MADKSEGYDTEQAMNELCEAVRARFPDATATMNSRHGGEIRENLSNDKPISLDEILYGERRECFNCPKQITEATLLDGRIVTLNDDRTHHADTCDGRSFKRRVEQEARERCRIMHHGG